MKTEIVKTEQNNQEIDWSIPMLLKAKNKEIYIMSTGTHNLSVFSGMIICDENIESESFLIADSWIKEEFTPITEPVTIKFIP